MIYLAKLYLKCEMFQTLSRRNIDQGPQWSLALLWCCCASVSSPQIAARQVVLMLRAWVKYLEQVPCAVRPAVRHSEVQNVSVVPVCSTADCAESCVQLSFHVSVRGSLMALLGHPAATGCQVLMTGIPVRWFCSSWRRGAALQFANISELPSTVRDLHS